MSFKFSKSCHRCFELGFHPTQNWHPTAPARQTHVLKHLRNDFDALEKEQDAQLLQKSRIVCFPVQAQTEDFRVCCFDCGALFEKKELVAHWLKNHQKKKQAKVKAGRRTRDKKKRPSPQSKKRVSDLHRHQRVLSGERLFPCHQCGKRFKRNNVLKYHERAIHNMHNPFICENCGKRFVLKTDVKRHLLEVHLNQKPFKCAQCNKSFGQKGTLTRHQANVHKKQKPFKCPQCTKSFGQKGTVTRHQAAVHESLKPFSCGVCGHKFSRKGNLKRHEEAIHGKQKSFQCRQ